MLLRSRPFWIFLCIHTGRRYSVLYGLIDYVLECHPFCGVPFVFDVQKKKEDNNFQFSCMRLVEIRHWIRIDFAFVLKSMKQSLSQGSNEYENKKMACKLGSFLIYFPTSSLKKTYIHCLFHFRLATPNFAFAKQFS